jgi:cephalosporin hydroxylase
MVEGGFAYGYLFMSQHRDTPRILKEFLSIVRPSRILEIGTFHGGLTLCLRDILDELELKNSPILTYDINNQEFLKPLVTNRNIDVQTKNLFDYNNNVFINEEAENEIRSFIQQDGLSLIMCDGGCKVCEYQILTPLLKNNDLIMAHDYSPNDQYFNEYMRDKIWDWMEIQDSDIANLLDSTLKPTYSTLLQRIAWCCHTNYSMKE